MAPVQAKRRDGSNDDYLHYHKTTEGRGENTILLLPNAIDLMAAPNRLYDPRCFTQDVSNIATVKEMNRGIPLQDLIRDPTVPSISQMFPLNKIHACEMRSPIQVTVHLPPSQAMESAQKYEQRVFSYPSSTPTREPNGMHLRPSYRCPLPIESCLKENHTLDNGMPAYFWPKKITMTIGDNKSYYSYSLSVTCNAVMNDKDSSDFAASSSSSDRFATRRLAEHKDANTQKTTILFCDDTSVSIQETASSASAGKPEYMKSIVHSQSKDVEAAMCSPYRKYFSYLLPEKYCQSAHGTRWLNLNPSSLLMHLLPTSNSAAQSPVVPWNADTQFGSGTRIDCVRYQVNDDFQNNVLVWFWIDHRNQILVKLKEEGITEESIASFLSGNFPRVITGDDDLDRDSENVHVTYIPVAATAFFIGEMYDFFDINYLLMPVSDHDVFLEITPLPPFGNVPVNHSGGKETSLNPPSLTVNVELTGDFIHSSFWGKQSWQVAKPAYDFFTKFYRKYKNVAAATSSSSVADGSKNHNLKFPHTIAQMKTNNDISN